MWCWGCQHENLSETILYECYETEKIAQYKSTLKSKKHAVFIRLLVTFHRQPQKTTPVVTSCRQLWVATVGSTFGSRYSIWFTVFIHWEKNPDISTLPLWFLHVRGVWVDGAYPISKFMSKKWHTWHRNINLVSNGSRKNTDPLHCPANFADERLKFGAFTNRSLTEILWNIFLPKYFRSQVFGVPKWCNWRNPKTVLSSGRLALWGLPCDECGLLVFCDMRRMFFEDQNLKIALFLVL